MKIVVLDGYTENPGDLSWAPLAQLGQLTVYPSTPPELVAQRIAGAQAVILNKVVLDRALIQGAAHLQYIGLLSTGYNVVDLSAARERNIPVTNIPGYATPSVAQFTFALLLELCHQVGRHNQAVQQGKWSSSPHFCFWETPQVELWGKTMGILGYGQIGRQVGAIAQAMGMKVLAAGRSNTPGRVSLEQLLKESDVISLNCPLTPQTQGIINKDTLAQMKDGAFLINTARGGLIVEADLRQALLSGKLAGAAVDVAGSEPIPVDSPLLGLPNLIITPHIAWAAREARQRLMDILVDNLRAFQQGSPRNVVN